MDLPEGMMTEILSRLSSMALSDLPEGMALSDLPEEMMTEILSRLPVKSVLVCKSVCKPWLSTISNPYFVKCQLQCAINNPRTLLIIKDYALDDEKRGTFVTLDKSPIQVDSLVMPTMFYELFDALPVVGSCNGILCLANIPNNAIYLWNPSIRQFKRIDAPFQCKLKYYKLGFGFDSICDDYKVFGVVYKTSTAVIPEVSVYSANADCWRHFQDPVLEKINLMYRDYNVVVNGVLYSYGVKHLISFDLHKEVFRLVPLPSFIQHKMSTIFDFEGSVALFFQSDGNGPRIFDLRTLDDASPQVSWSKKCSIDLNTLEYGWSIWTECYLGAGLFWGITQVTEDDSFHCVLYNSEKREAKYYGQEEGVHATLKYTETLVAFDGFQQVEEDAN